MTAFVIIVIGYLTYTLNGPVYTTAHTVSIKILKKSIYIISNLIYVGILRTSVRSTETMFAKWNTHYAKRSKRKPFTSLQCSEVFKTPHFEVL